MNSAYSPVDNDFLDKLQEAVKFQDFIRLQYFSDINEFITLTQVAKEIIIKNEAKFLRLSNGEEIRLDKIVRVNEYPAPGYNEDFFKCDI
jgi:Rho-binding antiterminator